MNELQKVFFYVMAGFIFWDFATYMGWRDKIIHALVWLVSLPFILFIVIWQASKKDGGV